MNRIFLPCTLLGLWIALGTSFTVGAGAQRFGGGGGASPRLNRSVNLQNRGNISLPAGSTRDNASARARVAEARNNPNVQNRLNAARNNPTNTRDRAVQLRNNPNVRNRVNEARNNPNLQNRVAEARNNSNSQNRVNNIRSNRNVRASVQNRANEIRNNRVTNVNIRNNNINIAPPRSAWGGGGWYGGGYYTPPGWGTAFTFAAGLAIGAALSAPPPYYTPVVIGSTRYVYSDGVFLQPVGGQYIVVRPPLGAVVDYLPDGCLTTQQGGIVLYDCSGVLYQPYYEADALVYRVVRL
ncbi:DUF6515 family protein [Gloeobacter kilaueensis]|uniref:Uncharacterized protein n=1 Tax=Gloeobacter kilaueensis (strain ATCC BAA-2537 / CCAP 1431/1 / ULC 316 / JS1) TaxID=1183438 RepID=U5QP50_GLOK1|nr:DUF6515 family protein [Gloeobacter kilaueensis]AGY59339.1 hypothetical protein GKIL_3093 [Gloeobacter kilaueensis JS1]